VLDLERRTHLPLGQSNGGEDFPHYAARIIDAKITPSPSVFPAGVAGLANVVGSVVELSHAID